MKVFVNIVKVYKGGIEMNVSNIIIQTLNSPEIIKVIRVGTVLVVISFGLTIMTKISEKQLEVGNIDESATLKLVSTVVHYMVLLLLVIGVFAGYMGLIENVISTFGLM